MLTLLSILASAKANGFLPELQGVCGIADLKTAFASVTAFCTGKPATTPIALTLLNSAIQAGIGSITAISGFSGLSSGMDLFFSKSTGGCVTATYTVPNGVKTVKLNTALTCGEINTSPKICTIKCNAARRNLLSSNSIRLSEESSEFHSYMDKCGDFEYDAALYVGETHLVALASPKEKDAIAAGCPFVAVHSVLSTEDNNVAAQKEIFIWEDKDEAEAFFSEKGSSLYVGTFPLDDLARAYQQAAPTADGKGVYDIVANNCGAFIVNLATELGIKVDSQITAFVARRLLEDGAKEFFDSIRTSFNYFSLFEGRSRLGMDNVSDKEIVDLLVEKHTSKLL
jgi:hypothetical protein